MAADDGGLTDNDAGSVVDKEVFADGGSRMDINTGFAVCLFRQHTRNQWNAQPEQFMGKPVNGDGIQSRIGKNNLILASCGRVSIVSGLQVGF